MLEIVERWLNFQISLFTKLGPYDFHVAENKDRIAQSSHKNGIYFHNGMELRQILDA